MSPDKKIEEIREGMRLLDQAHRKITHSEFSYTMARLYKAYTLVLERFAPFKVGDRVKLIRKIDFESAPGWKGGEHFLQPGAMATVKESEVDGDGKLRFYLHFDAETYKHFETKELLPVKEKSLYCFGEKSLELLPKECPTCHQPAPSSDGKEVEG